METMLQKILDISIIIIVTSLAIYVADLIIKYFFKKIINKARGTDMKKRLATLRTVLISIIAIIISTAGFFKILAEFGINLKHLMATAGIVGIAIGFGAKRLVEDFISGIAILSNNQIMVDDVVKIQGITGTVEKINLKMVILRDNEGAVHFFRNSSIDTITNYTRNYSYAVFEIPIAYKENVTYVVDVIKELGNEFRNSPDYNKIILDELEIFGLDKFLDNAVQIKFRIKTKPGKQWMVKRALNLQIKQRFEEKGIEIPFNQIVVTNR